MITIIGAGKVGGDAAMFCALRSLGDVLLLDIVDAAPWRGHGHKSDALRARHRFGRTNTDVVVVGSGILMDSQNLKT